MSQHVFHNIKIAGVAGAAPSQVIDNRGYYERLGKKAVDDFIKLTGIERHHKSPRKQTACDLGYAAASELLEKLDIDRKDIGAVIDVTQSGDYMEPSTAFVLHKRLQLEHSCIAFDVNLGCAGYCGVSVADNGSKIYFACGGRCEKAAGCGNKKASRSVQFYDAWRLCDCDAY